MSDDDPVRIGHMIETAAEIERFIIEREQSMDELKPIAIRRFTGSDFLALVEALPRPAAEFLDVVEELARSQASIGDSPSES